MKFLAILFLLTAASCSSRDYHAYMLQETMLNSKQAEEIKKIQAIDEAEDRGTEKKYCKTYDKGFGGFTYSCNK